MNFDLSQRCVRALSELAKTKGAAISISSDRIRIGSEELQLRARIENDLRREERYFFGLVVDVSVNGTPEPLAIGTIGIGATRDEAIQTAIDEWTQLTGYALLGALGIKMAESSVHSGSFAIYRGATGIRGDMVWSKENDGQLLKSLEPVIASLGSSSTEFHSIWIMLVVQPNGVIDGECRLDGSISQPVINAARTFRWPTISEPYMFKQYFVLRRVENHR